MRCNLAHRIGQSAGFCWLRHPLIFGSNGLSSRRIYGIDNFSLFRLSDTAIVRLNWRFSVYILYVYSKLMHSLRTLCCVCVCMHRTLLIHKYDACRRRMAHIILYFNRNKCCLCVQHLVHSFRMRAIIMIGHLHGYFTFCLLLLLTRNIYDKTANVYAIGSSMTHTHKVCMTRICNYNAQIIHKSISKWKHIHSLTLKKERPIATIKHQMNLNLYLCVL